MSLPSYPEYKDSGLEWFAEIPKHWCVSRLSRLAEVIDPQPDHRAPPIVQGDGYPYVGIRDLNADGTVNFDTARQVAEDAVLKQESAFVIRKGDIVFCKVGTLGFPRQIRPHGRLALSATLVLIKPRSDVSSRFLLHSLDAIGIYAQIGYFSTGSTRAALGIEQIRRFVLPAPPLDEQLTLASFLDRETGKIDALIAEQEKLLTLLAEKRQATISHAVTKGLNPDAPMKDSGVAWLGEVPEHWGVCSLRRVVAAIEQGWSPECHAREAEENEWGVLKAGCLNGGVFRPSENKALPPELSPDANYEVRMGDVLMSRASGSPELVGSTALVSATRPGLMLSDKIFRLRLHNSMMPRYFVAALNSRALRVQIENALSGGNGMANNLPQSNLLSFLIPVPPHEEQSAIADFITAETGRLDALKTESERAIALLKERRSALIAAAVTGQIDVRGLVTEPEAA